MVKAYDKCKKLIEKEGHFKTYIRAVAELEIFINEVNREKKEQFLRTLILKVVFFI